MTTRRKQAVAAASHPLADASVLQQVFSVVPGHWLFLGAVCREWRDAYAELADQQVFSIDHHLDDQLVTCGSTSTLYSAAVASPATARLASKSGLKICTNKNVQVNAGAHANVQILAALRELGMPFGITLMKAAAASGRLDILQHLIIAQRCPKFKELSCYAARSGSIDMLKWLRTQKRCVFDRSTCAAAASGDRLAALKHLRSEGCDWNVATIAYDAVRAGSRGVIEWLQQQQDILIDAGVMAAAASAGQTAICDYLRSTGCDWNAEACYQTTIRGHVDALRWLRENGCPWNVSEVLHNAACFNYTDMIDFVMEQGEALSSELLTRALHAAGTRCQLQAAQSLKQHGAEWPAVLSHWCGNTLAWARAEGCTSPTRTP
jgi:hypothetical protein